MLVQLKYAPKSAPRPTHKVYPSPLPVWFSCPPFVLGQLGEGPFPFGFSRSLSGKTRRPLRPRSGNLRTGRSGPGRENPFPYLSRSSGPSRGKIHFFIANLCEKGIGFQERSEEPVKNLGRFGRRNGRKFLRISPKVIMRCSLPGEMPGPVSFLPGRPRPKGKVNVAGPIARSAQTLPYPRPRTSLAAGFAWMGGWGFFRRKNPPERTGGLCGRLPRRETPAGDGFASESHDAARLSTNTGRPRWRKSFPERFRPSFRLYGSKYCLNQSAI